MRIRRRLPIILAVLLVAAAVALAVVLRKHAPPEAARLLPAADGFIYANVGWMRRANLTGELPAVPHDPEYEQFIQATGFQFERDLDEAALAIHDPASSPGAKPDTAAQPRFSEVFVGKFNGERLRTYLHKISSSVENYQPADVYNIPLEGRTVRVAILGVDTVAASNLDDPLVIRGIIDRSRKLASPFGGPALLRQYYKEVPFASLAWAVFKIQPSAGVSTSGPIGWSLLFPKPATIVASLRYLGAVHFKAQAFTASEDDASQLTARIDTYLNLFRAAESTVSTPGPDPDMKAFFDSLKIQPEKARASLTATVPLGLIRKALAEAPSSVTPESQPPQSPTPQDRNSKTKGKKTSQ
ncbi:MAG TPA: hypothetical protein VNZ03_24535 [Terriglobales bacterium]|nr:hypothetical protein [Terriglobales bacterium]